MNFPTFPRRARTATADAFPLSLAEAAEELGLFAHEVVDLVRVGTLGAYHAPRDLCPDEPRLLFARADVEALAAVLSADTADDEVVELRAIVNGLRAHLRARPPTARLAEASAQARPVLAKDRAGEVGAHVRLEVFLEWMRAEVDRAHVEHPELGRLVRARMESDVASALERLGAIRRRGFRTLEGDRTNGWWWRLPPSVWGRDGADLAGMPTWGPSVARGERVRRDGDGSWVEG